MYSKYCAGLALTLFAILTATGFGFAQRSGVRGRVTDLTGLPIAGCEVTLRSKAGAEQLTHTNSDGIYVLQTSAAGGTLTFRSAGFKMEVVEYSTPSDRETVIDIGLEPGQLGPLPGLVVRGQVTSMDRHPLGDVSIRLTNIFNSRVSGSALTSESGSFVVELKLPGLYSLVMTKPGFQPYGTIMFVASSHSVPRTPLKRDQFTKKGIARMRVRPAILRF